MPRQTFPCPRCNRTLKCSGETTVEGQAVALDVFQCDECIDTWEFDGEEFEHSLTFAVDAHGRALDPETLDPLDLSKWSK